MQAPDECEPELSRTLKRIVDHANAYLKRPLDVELFTNSTFMGLFVTENDANFLKRIALQYVKEVSPSSELGIANCSGMCTREISICLLLRF